MCVDICKHEHARTHTHSHVAVYRHACVSVCHMYNRRSMNGVCVCVVWNMALSLWSDLVWSGLSLSPSLSIYGLLRSLYKVKYGLSLSFSQVWSGLVWSGLPLSLSLVWSGLVWSGPFWSALSLSLPPSLPHSFHPSVLPCFPSMSRSSPFSAVPSPYGHVRVWESWGVLRRARDSRKHQNDVGRA